VTASDTGTAPASPDEAEVAAVTDVTAAVAAALVDLNGYDDDDGFADADARELLAELADAGLAVLPAEQIREEWAVVYGVDPDEPLSPPVEGAGTITYDDEAAAAEMVQWLAGSVLVRRTVHFGPWEPAPAEPCSDCDGCGQVADTDDREPWTAWTALPVRSALAVTTGMVRPVPCGSCGGTGRSS
jgi:hypothetical protein